MSSMKKCIPLYFAIIECSRGERTLLLTEVSKRIHTKNQITGLKMCLLVIDRENLEQLWFQIAMKVLPLLSASAGHDESGRL